MYQILKHESKCNYCNITKSFDSDISKDFAVHCIGLIFYKLIKKKNKVC